ncbi:hypothetical protein SORBI_3002G402366 [Sorghum bicolor]|uniref:Uncharacterized protein n=1 Tax=Sorghum bicolor TaxID=4558 RepID=C5X437_SORBI|nr:hypothetical protein SORBI_3002G402366 [Sorghum bicolor]
MFLSMLNLFRRFVGIVFELCFICFTPAAMVLRMLGSLVSSLVWGGRAAGAACGTQGVLVAVWPVSARGLGTGDSGDGRAMRNGRVGEGQNLRDGACDAERYVAYGAERRPMDPHLSNVRAPAVSIN